MARNDNGKEIKKLLEDVFGSYPGSELGKPLKDGASIQGVVEGEEYSLRKSNGSLVISTGAVHGPDISVVLNRATCEYVSGAGGLEEFISRSRECIDGRRDGCVFEYRIHASLPRLLLKGYLDFARSFGII